MVGRVRVLVLLALAAAAIGTGPAEAQATAPANGWVGKVSGTRTFVGLAARGNALIAYACDGRRVGRWFQGRRRGRQAVLRDDRRRRLVVRFQGRTVTARLNLPGRRSARVVLVRARKRAGLFRRERIVPRRGGAPRTRLEGWVRLNNGRVRGLALARTLRVRRPRPGIEVFLLPSEAASPVFAPVGGPPADARIRAAVVNPCAGRSTTCGLPERGMRIGQVRRSARVVSADADATISAAALQRILAEAPLVRDREEASLISAAGIPAFPPTRTRPPVRNSFDALARSIVADADVTGTATALRLARTVEARTAAAGRLARLATRFAALPIGEIERPEIAIRETGNPGTLDVFTTETLTSGAAVTEEVVLEGPEAEVRENLEIEGQLAILGGIARAGFHSSAEFADRAHVEIEVPPGARSVEIEFDASHFVSFDTGRPGCLSGVGSGMTSRSVALWARNADGTYHIADEAPVDGIYLDLQTATRLPSILFVSCIFEPPAPPPPGLIISGLPGLRIANPQPQGGRFLITVEAGGQAHTIADGQAETRHGVAIAAITVRTEF